MLRYELSAFGLSHLAQHDVPAPTKIAPHEVRVGVRAISLNYRDLAVIEGTYNRKLKLPAVPLSDAAGEVLAIGSAVEEFQVGDRVVTHFVSAWQDGPYQAKYLKSTLGTPGCGVAAQEIVVPATALLPIPSLYSFEQAATLPIAALTAYSALVIEGRLSAKETMVTLGTGGVSLFAIQIAKALGARAVVTSRHQSKLITALELGADLGIDTADNPDWAGQVLDFTEGEGAHVTLESVGIATFNDSVKATRAGGTIALFGSLSGLRGDVNLSPLFMKRLKIAGIMVDHRTHMRDMLDFFSRHRLAPVIDSTFSFGEIPQALAYLARGEHVGKICIAINAS